jgi:hypothetical protein
MGESVAGVMLKVAMLRNFTEIQLCGAKIAGL